MYRSLTTFGVLVVLFSISMSARAACLDKSIPLQVPSEVDIVRLRSLKVSADDSMEGTFFFQNRSPKAMAFVTVVLDYETKDPDHLTVVYEAATNDQQPSESLIPAEYVQKLGRPISSGEQKWLRGSSPYTLPSCPVSAQLVMLDVRFADESHFKWESPNWWTMPLLFDYPEYFRVSDSRAWTAKKYYFLAKINHEGRLVDSVMISPTANLPSDTVQESLKRLIFAPALRNDKPHDGGIIVVVRFHRSPTDENAKDVPEPPSLRGPRVTIDLYPHDSEATDWTFDFGKGWGYTSKHVRHQNQS